MKAVILAGGGGTRLWPVSRKKLPKQNYPFISKDTLLQQTFKRLLKNFKLEDIYLATNISHRNLVRRQLGVPADKMKCLYEPVKRDTAAAIGLVATYLSHANPKAIMFTANSDHYIKDEKEYFRILKLTERLVKKFPDHIVLVGINPTYPETGYGYIKLAHEVMKLGKDSVFKAEKFIEKPDLARAKSYLKKWNYLWNPAIFVWRVDHLLNLYKKFLPQTFKILMKIKKSIGTKNESRILKQEFRKIKPISIDYGIMEKTKKMLAVPADLGWTDVGHWRSVKEILSETAEDNIIRGKHLGIDTKGSLIYSLSNKLITTAGIENMIIIDTKDALLICPKDRAQDVKKIVENLEKRPGGRRYL